VSGDAAAGAGAVASGVVADGGGEAGAGLAGAADAGGAVGAGVAGATGGLTPGSCADTALITAKIANAELPSSSSFRTDVNMLNPKAERRPMTWIDSVIRTIEVALRRDTVAHKPRTQCLAARKRTEQSAQAGMSGFGRAAGVKQKMVKGSRLNGRQ
jgi:hypothetical protein